MGPGEPMREEESMTEQKGVTDREAGLLQRLIFRGAKARRGAVPEPLRLMARSSGLLWAGTFFELCFGRARRVDANLKSLASLKTAGLVGCVF